MVAGDMGQADVKASIRQFRIPVQPMCSSPPRLVASGISLFALVAGLALPAPAGAQEMPPPVPESAEDAAITADLTADPGISSFIDGEEEIVVTGTFQRGSVPGDIKPEIQLNAGDIRAFGASNLADLLQELAPQLRSGRGRGGEAPVVLVNGRRVSGFAEIRNLPPEALERVDILPEEVALKYGYRADQRVINFVLRENFMATTVELEGGMATDGGQTTLEGEGNFLRLGNGSRFSLEGEYSRAGILLESERQVLTPTPSQPF
ncbi:TonB-dependent receptor, partial [Polymorphobacter sp.]|uniref:TonB-dependent receptor n=1 Tax=Polymorphobacter sp. TaxID=1909290 RepID=UPI003F6FEFBF